MRLQIRSMTSALVLGAMAWIPNSTAADEREETKAKVEAVRREAQELAKNGDFAGAQKLWEESKALMSSLNDRPSEERDSRRPQPEQAKRLERIAQRMMHLRNAAEHLKAAEMHDMAMDMMHRAEEMERDLVHGKEALAREMKLDPDLPKPLAAPHERDAARQEVRRMQEHISETTRRLQEENEQLRGEMRELRAMVERIAKELKRLRDPELAR